MSYRTQRFLTNASKLTLGLCAALAPIIIIAKDVINQAGH